MLGNPASPLPPSGVQELLHSPGLPFDHGRTREAEQWSWTSCFRWDYCYQGGKRGRSLEGLGGGRAGLEEESDIYTRHTRVSPRVARTVAATIRRGEGWQSTSPLFL